MKRKFTRLLAALGLLVFMTPSMVGWGQTRDNITETMTASDLTATGSSYSDFSNVALTNGSNARYAGQSAKDNDGNIQLRSKNSNSGIVSTTSGGKIKSVKITVGSGTGTISVYGNNTAYTSATELYATGSNSNQGTLIQEITSTTTITVSTDYAYVGIRSKSGAVYISSIEFTWEPVGGGGTPSITISPATIPAEYTGLTSTGYDANGLSITTENISNPSLSNFSVVYCDTENGTYTENAPSWMLAYVVQGSSFKVGYSINENSTQSINEGYFKVMYGQTESNAVHVTQSAAPAPQYSVTVSGNAIAANYAGDVAGAAITVSTDLTGNEIAYSAYYNNGGNYSSNNPYDDWFEATVNPSNQIVCTVMPNTTGTERTAQFKINAIDDNYDEANSEVITLTQGTVAAPTFTPDGGNFHGTQSVTIASETPGASLRYTLDGTTPTATVGTEYNGPFSITESATVKAIAYVVVSSETCPSPMNSATFTQEQVATPTFSPAAGAVNAGTEVTISCTTAGATIQYSIDEGATWETGSSVTINVATTIQAKATASGYLDSQTATASYSVKGNAEFTNGVYSETMTTEASFNNMQVVNVQGDQTWQYYSSTPNSAYISGYNSGYVANKDWLITPKMGVNNGKLYVSCSVRKNYQSNQLSWKWSTSNDVNGEWNNLAYTEPTSNNSWQDQTAVIETNADYVYVAFVYDNTSAEAAAAYWVDYFRARQYYNVTFDANNASATGTMAAQAFPAGLATALNANAFSVSGKTFTGWNTAADGSGTAYADGANITITVNTTLYAQWADAYTVSFTTNGIADGSVQVTQGQAIGTLPTPTAEYIPSGYEFTGWLATDHAVSNTAPSEYITAPYQPSSDVTLKAVFAEASGTPASLTKMTSSDSFVADDKVVIVASDNVAMYQATVSSSYVNKYTFDNNAATVAADDKNWLTVSAGSTDGTWKLGDATNGYVYNNSSNNLKIDTENSTDFTLAWNTSESKFTLKNGSRWLSYRDDLTAGNQYFRMGGTGTTPSGTAYFDIYKFVPGSSSYSNYRTSFTINSGEVVVGTYSSTKDGYKLIASPVYVDPENVSDMTTDNFDLYYFDQNESEEWRNYEVTPFNLVPGKGYLYAKQDGVTLSFTGAPYNGDGVIALDYVDGKRFAGWNLIGNPYTTDATIPGNQSYYTLNPAGAELIAGESTTIGAMEGIFVKATTTGQSVTFTAASKGSRGDKELNSRVVLNLNGNHGVIDRAIVRFSEGGVLPKFMMNPENTRIYIRQDNEDFAVLNSNGQGEMPVNFKTAEDGTYTISVEAENLDVNYLHLIDNKTGMDVDLLATPSYTFEARKSDIASRFRLVFDANTGNDETNDNFAFINNGELIVNGNGTVQVIDILGRQMFSHEVNSAFRIQNSSFAPGVYVLRLVNGNDVKTQKIVIK